MNRTLELEDGDVEKFQSDLIEQLPCQILTELPEGIVKGDCFEWAKILPEKSVDILFLDPPYNLSKNFHGLKFSQRKIEKYSDWLDGVIRSYLHVLKDGATVYICGDWLTSASIYDVASRYFDVQNRITWEREKGRGAKRNWKNSCEDIWFCTLGKNYKFNVDAVRHRRVVIAPYKNSDGSARDWVDSSDGKFRDTCPSNIWTDITIPFWSMPENTKHPTQKSEKLLAKLILASSDEGDMVLDPFAGSGTTAVVAQKLNRRFLGIDMNEEYCLLALKRLELARENSGIQGYSDGVFWQRNSLPHQKKCEEKNGSRE